MTFKLAYDNNPGDRYMDTDNGAGLVGLNSKDIVA